MSTRLYLIETLTNMHVGSGEVNYGVIDNLIQRDPVTARPVINSSSLKGALREALKNKEYINKVFGSKPTESKSKQGSARFFDANILSIPVRSNRTPYIMITSAEVLSEFQQKIEIFNCDPDDVYRSELKQFISDIKLVSKPFSFDESLKGAVLEDPADTVETTFDKVSPKMTKFLSNLLGPNLVIVPDGIFQKLCDNNHLPVIARNNLENGQSANLWYEQVLPRYTRLYFIIKDGDDIHSDLIEEKAIFQIGANVSIGYGFCKISDALNPFGK